MLLARPAGICSIAESAGSVKPASNRLSLLPPATLLLQKNHTILLKKIHNQIDSFVASNRTNRVRCTSLLYLILVYHVLSQTHQGQVNLFAFFYAIIVRLEAISGQALTPQHA